MLQYIHTHDTAAHGCCTVCAQYPVLASVCAVVYNIAKVVYYQVSFLQCAFVQPLKELAAIDIGA
jgi:hypothetical protein